MTNQELLKRITCDHAVMVDKPVIRGTRLTVEYILNLLAQGSTVQEIRQRLSLKILCLAAHFPAHLTPGRNGATTQSFFVLSLRLGVLASWRFFAISVFSRTEPLPEILDEYEGLQTEDIQACLLFASLSLSSAAFMPLVAESA